MMIRVVDERIYIYWDVDSTKARMEWWCDDNADIASVISDLERVCLVIRGLTDRAKNVKHIHVSDTLYIRMPSTFMKCHSLSYMWLLLKGRSPFQIWFNASIAKDVDQESYDVFIRNMSDPDKKPVHFAFYCVNPEYTKTLNELFERTVTWRQFFDDLQIIYNEPVIYDVMVRWYEDVYNNLCEISLPQEWILTV